MQLDPAFLIDGPDRSTTSYPISIGFQRNPGQNYLLAAAITTQFPIMIRKAIRRGAAATCTLTNEG